MIVFPVLLNERQMMTLKHMCGEAIHQLTSDPEVKEEVHADPEMRRGLELIVSIKAVADETQPMEVRL